MRVLAVTNMFPTERNPQFGIFVKEQVQSIRALGVDVDVMFVNGREGRLRQKGYPLGFPRLWGRLFTSSYDVIHAHYVFSGIISRAQWAVPLVLTHHGSELRDPVQGRLCRWTRNWPDDLIVVAQWMADDLGVPAHVIPCGVDLELFRPIERNEARMQLGLDPRKRYILFAGYTWDPVKRFHLVEEATEIVRSRNLDVELLAICQQPHEVIPLYMSAADVFAMTSISEGSAQVIKEAMACNLPIVATDAGDNWQVLGDTSGCYRTSADPRTIADALEAAISPPRRTDGRATVHRFGLEATANAVVSVYESATNRAASSADSAKAGRKYHKPRSTIGLTK